MTTAGQNKKQKVETILKNEVWHVVGNPKHPEHDQDGFRNNKCESPDLFITGDSWTYGATLTLKQSWPILLSKKIGVFNASIGGWGPLEYYLAVKKFMSIKSKVCIVCIYMGNDMIDAINHLEKTGSDVRAKFWKDEYAELKDRVKFPNRIRRNQIARLEQTLGNSIKAFKAADEDEKVDVQVINAGGKDFYLKSLLRQETASMQLDRVRAGVEITKKCLEEIIMTCDDMGIEPAFVFFPTKESSFVQEAKGTKWEEMIAKVKTNETETENNLIEFLDGHYATILNTRQMLEDKAVECYNYNTMDGHPNAHGAKLIADFVFEGVKDKLDDFDNNNYPLA